MFPEIPLDIEYPNAQKLLPCAPTNAGQIFGHSDFCTSTEQTLGLQASENYPSLGIDSSGLLQDHLLLQTPVQDSCIN